MRPASPQRCFPCFPNRGNRLRCESAMHRGWLSQWERSRSNHGNSSMKRKIYLLGNPQKRGVAATLEALKGFAAEHAEVVGMECSQDGGPAVKAGADRIIV